MVLSWPGPGSLTVHDGTLTKVQYLVVAGGGDAGTGGVDSGGVLLPTATSLGSGTYGISVGSDGTASTGGWERR